MLTLLVSIPKRYSPSFFWHNEGMEIKGNFLDTVEDIMGLMAPSSGGAIPESNSEEYGQWLLFIQTKYEEASRRGFWRRLLTKGELSLTEGDVEALLPVNFQRPNGLYILYVDGVDVCDPDRLEDDQSIFVEMENDSDSADFGRWRVTFSTPIASTQTAPIWYFAAPPMPTTSSDKVLLPGDMIAYGALSEVFRTSSLEGSQDDARTEYENRFNVYLNMETIPARHEILKFVTNPRRVDYLQMAKSRYTSTRGTRVSRSI